MQTRNKNDLLNRLDAYLNKHGKTTVINPGKASFETWQMNEMTRNNNQISLGRIYLRTLDRQEFDKLLQTHVIFCGIYSCTDLNAIKGAFEDVVKINTVEAERAVDYGNHNMESAFRYYIEFLLDMNGIII